MADKKKKLFLIDGFAIIYRSYFAFSRNPLVNSKGVNVSAIQGFANTLVDIMGSQKPTHLVLVLDAPGKTFRAQEHEFYKANRPEMPEDIRSSIPIIKELTTAFKIPILLLEGHEADDIIGTIAKKAEKDDFDVFMVTPDKDFGQLVSENIFMYKPGSRGKPSQVMGPKEICDYWDIENVSQVIDILGMMGDASDNIPGIPSVGQKTAVKFLKQFGTLEETLNRAEEIKGKVGEKVRENREQALISKKLATIVLDVPVEYKPETYILEEPDRDKLAQMFSELEFRGLGRRILGTDYSINQTTAPAPRKKGKGGKVSGQLNLFGDEEMVNEVNAQLLDNEKKSGNNIENTPHEYHLIDDAAGRKKLISLLKKSKQFCFDTETTSIDANEAELVGIAFSFKEKEAYYVPISEKRDEAEAVLSEFREIFESDKLTKIGQNLKYDILVLKWHGIEVSGPFEDTLLAHYLIEPEMRHNLDILSETYLKYSPVSITELIGKKGKNQGSMRDVPLDKVKEYAGEDADLALQLHHHFKKAIADKDGVGKVYRDIEIPLMPVLADMEYEGITLDKEFLETYSIQIKGELVTLQHQIFDTAGQEFNIDSPKQMGEVLFEKMEIPYSGKKTKTGQYSTAEETLKKVARKHPIADLILKYRGWTKLKSTYVDALPLMVNAKTGRVHTNFNQAVAATGRLSSNNPNLQNIPIRTEQGREVRKAFIPRSEEFTLLAADYSQIELRIMAQLSGDEAMKSAFMQKKDIHTITAAKVYEIEEQEVDREMRSRAKMVNFGIIYGISAFGLSQRLGIKRKEAKLLIDGYFETYPGIKKYMEQCVTTVREKRYAETIMGRRRYLKDIESHNYVVRSFAERNAINTPIQGSAADLIKIAMINVQAEMKKRAMKSRMLLQVHDELLFDAHLDELEELKDLVGTKMTSAIDMEVPLDVEMGTGDNWLESH